MRVLLIANTLPDRDISGVGEQVVQLAAGLRSLGHEVRILGRGSDSVRGPKLLFALASVPATLRLCRQWRPDVVQVHESDGALAALAVRILQPFLEPGPRVVVLLQVSYVEELRAVRSLRSEGRVLGRPGPKEWAFRWLKAPVQIALGCLTAWLADLVLAPSRHTAMEVMRDYGVSPVAVVPNATSASSTPEIARQDWQESAPLLFVGRLRIRKGVETLLHAMHRLQHDVPWLRLLVVGDGEHRSRLQRTAARLGVGDAVQFLGRRDSSQVRALMAEARALVVPSIYEGMPLVILEAMATGLPVVASAVSGIPEVVQEGRTGWLVEPENVTALARVLKEVYEQPAEAQRRGAAARRWVAANATPTAAARRWLELVDAG